MSLELIIFLVVAAVAIFSSAFMLISQNAVHSALFLVTTMICLAFFYLILIQEETEQDHKLGLGATLGRS